MPLDFSFKAHEEATSNGGTLLFNAMFGCGITRNVFTSRTFTLNAEGKGSNEEAYDMLRLKKVAHERFWVESIAHAKAV